MERHALISMRFSPFIHPRHRRNASPQLIWIVALLTVFHCAVWANSIPESETPTLLLVVGASGEPQYESNFVHQVAAWQQTVDRASATGLVIGVKTNEAPTDRELLQQTLEAQPHDGSSALWLVLIGHGTFDGTSARFNLRGPDVSSTELAEWLKPFIRPLVIINTTSASGPFLKSLADTNRVIITATRSGDEVSFARFGASLAESFQDAEADLDRDDQVSLLEAFLTASARVNEFYDTEGRLATEHALLDDNGDGKGTPPDWFQGVRAIKSASDGAVDGLRAHQLHLVMSPDEHALSPETRARRDALEHSIATLRNRKEKLAEADYYDQLEVILLRLARLYQTNAPSNAQPSSP